MNQLHEFWRLLSQYSNNLEIIQTVLALSGLIFAIWAMVDSVRDSMSLMLRGRNGPRRVIATDNIYTEIERIGVQSILFLIGFASVFLPPPFAPGDVMSSPELLQHTLTRLGMMSITVWKVAMSLRARHARYEFRRQLIIDRMDQSTTRSEIAPPPGEQID